MTGPFRYKRTNPGIHPECYEVTRDGVALGTVTKRSEAFYGAMHVSWLPRDLDGTRRPDAKRGTRDRAAESAWPKP
jgi:hypothetical protein